MTSYTRPRGVLAGNRSLRSTLPAPSGSPTGAGDWETRATTRRQLRPPRAGRMGIKGLTKLLGDNAPRCIKEHELKSYFGRKSVPPRPVSP
jgi:hypothetical protein